MYIYLFLFYSFRFNLVEIALRSRAILLPIKRIEASTPWCVCVCVYVFIFYDIMAENFNGPAQQLLLLRESFFHIPRSGITKTFRLTLWKSNNFPPFLSLSTFCTQFP